MWPTWPKKLTPAGYCVPQPHKLFFRFIHASTHMCKSLNLYDIVILAWLSNTKSISIFKFWKSTWSNCNPSPNPCQDKQNKFTDIKYFNLQMPGESSTFWSIFFPYFLAILITPCRFFFLFSDSFVNSQEWTLSRGVPDIRLGIVGSLSSGKSALVHRYLTGSYMQEESPEGGRFKKEVVVDGHSYLLLIRDEGGPPELQVTIPS